MVLFIGVPFFIVMQIIEKYFPDLTALQKRQFKLLPELYYEWNCKINVVSRKDIGLIEERHILHSLAIAKILKAVKGTTFMDAGTGGGFPGLPLAILFPECSFHLVDSIGKKIKVVSEITYALGLTNVTAEKARFEEITKKYDFVISRAVCDLISIHKMTKDRISNDHKNEIPNGILYLKGGDFSEELESIKSKVQLFEIHHFFSESFYITKKIVHIPNI
jgi:16S rRNA (guanine527-N7)-methyltransferase